MLPLLQKIKQDCTDEWGQIDIDLFAFSVIALMEEQESLTRRVPGDDMWEEK